MAAYTGKKLNTATDYLMNIIKGNKLMQGDQLPTEKEMVQASGVSRVTLRRALANLQSEGMIYSVQGGGYYVGRVFQNSSMNFIPFVVSYDNHTSKILDVIQGAQDYLDSVHCRLSVTISGRDPNREREIIHQYYQDGIRCLIVFPVSSEDNIDFYFEMARSGMNFIFIDRKPTSLSSCNFIQSDNMMGGYVATRHLVDQGHRRIAAFGLEPMQHTSTIGERVNGYKRALQECKLDIPEKHYFYSPYRVSSPDLEALLDPNNGYTAVFCISDAAAVDFAQHAYRMGIRIPQDISIVGFDNLDITANFSPPISTIEQSFTSLGKTGAEIAYSYLTDNHIGFTNRILPVKLIVRDSSGIKLEPSEE